MTSLLSCLCCLAGKTPPAGLRDQLLGDVVEGAEAAPAVRDPRKSSDAEREPPAESVVNGHDAAAISAREQPENNGFVEEDPQAGDRASADDQPAPAMPPSPAESVVNGHDAAAISAREQPENNGVVEADPQAGGGANADDQPAPAMLPLQEFQQTDILGELSELQPGGIAETHIVQLRYQGEVIEAVKKSMWRDPIFYDELAILSAIHQAGGHPHVIRCFGSIAPTEAGPGSLFLEYANQTDLYHVLSIETLQRPLNLKLPELCGQMASGLDFLHGLGIIHRDIKLENILLDITAGGSWQIKITDVGSAVRIPEGETTVPDDIFLITTLEYVAPEMFQGRPYGVKVDIFAFAIVLWLIGTLNTREPYSEARIQEKLPWRPQARKGRCPPFKHTYYQMACAGERPDLDQIRFGSAIESYKSLIKSMWHPVPAERPAASEVYEVFSQAPRYRTV